MPVSQVLTLVRRKNLVWSRPGNAGYVGPVRFVTAMRGWRLSWQGDGLIAVLGFTIARGKIVAIDVLADPKQLNRIGNMTR
jgi:hypothetical protein